MTIFDAAIGEVVERKLVNGDGEAERFYRGLSAPARVGTEACGNSQWLIDLLERLGSISKQGNRFLRQLLVEAAQSVTRLDEGFRKQYVARCRRTGQQKTVP